MQKTLLQKKIMNVIKIEIKKYCEYQKGENANRINEMRLNKL